MARYRLQGKLMGAGKRDAFEPSATMLTELANRGARFALFRALCTVAPPCSVEGVSGGGPLAEQGVAPGSLFQRSSEHRVVSDHRPPLARGAALDGCNGQDEGRRECRLDRGEVMLVRPGPEERSQEEKRHQWSAGRRACRKARGTSNEVPDNT